MIQIPKINSNLSAYYKSSTLIIPFYKPIEGYDIELKIKDGFNQETIVDGLLNSNISFNDNKVTFSMSAYKDMFIDNCAYLVYLRYVDKEGNKGAWSAPGTMYCYGELSISTSTEYDTEEGIFQFRCENKQYNNMLEEIVFEEYIDNYLINTKTYKIDYSKQAEWNNIIINYEVCKIITSVSLMHNIKIKYKLFKETEWRSISSVNLEETPAAAITLLEDKLSGDAKFQESDNSYAFILNDANKPCYRVTNPTENVYVVQLDLGEESIRDYNISHNENALYLLEEGVNTYSLIKKKIEFEYTFIYDRYKQYRLKYNFDISNFKETVQENKINTIGGCYPIIFRNGMVKYKEFSIEGLLSYLAEDISDTQSKRSRTPESKIMVAEGSKTDINATNIERERNYKLEFLEWINNGEPKVIKSPYYGNYIIYIMNAQFRPFDLLHGMIDTFTAQCVEIDEYNFENLKKYGLLLYYLSITGTTGSALMSSDNYLLQDLNDNYLIAQGGITI